MLSREPAKPLRIEKRRNDTVAYTYDIQNTSTKLIIVNFANKDNRIRGHHDPTKLDTETSRCCECLTNEETPSCACIHRDKTLSGFSSRHYNKCCKSPSSILPPTGPPHTRQSIHPSTSVNQTAASPHSSNSSTPKLPEVKQHNKESFMASSKKQPQQITSARVSTRDIELMRSIPALTSNEFSTTQKLNLLRLARIYTNVGPNIDSARLNNASILSNTRYTRSALLLANKRPKTGEVKKSKQRKKQKQQQQKVKESKAISTKPAERRSSLCTAMDKYGDDLSTENDEERCYNTDTRYIDDGNADNGKLNETKENEDIKETGDGTIEGSSAEEPGQNEEENKERIVTENESDESKESKNNGNNKLNENTIEEIDAEPNTLEDNTVKIEENEVNQIERKVGMESEIEVEKENNKNMESDEVHNEQDSYKVKEEETLSIEKSKLDEDRKEDLKDEIYKKDSNTKENSYIDLENKDGILEEDIKERNSKNDIKETNESESINVNEEESDNNKIGNDNCEIKDEETSYLNASRVVDKDGLNKEVQTDSIEESQMNNKEIQTEAEDVSEELLEDFISEVLQHQLDLLHNSSDMDTGQADDEEEQPLKLLSEHLRQSIINETSQIDNNNNSLNSNNK